MYREDKMHQLQELLETHILDPKNPEKLFELAKEYDRLGQGAMSVSLFLKTADLTEDRLLQYKCLCGIGLSYERQGGRTFTVEGAFLDAAALMPDRPEAHYFLARMYSEQSRHKHSLYHSNAGLKAETVLPKLDYIGDQYPGRTYMAFYNTIATWYIAGQQNGKHKLFDLKYKVWTDDFVSEKVDKMLSQIFYPDTIPYKKHDEPRFKYPFPGLQGVMRNYSKHFQDLFVLTAFKGKRNGTYLEIGSGEPITHNNTYLLESGFGWKGISIDNDPGLCCAFKEERNNTVICADATDIGFEDLFAKHCVDPVIDYLQVDCDDVSLQILENIPFDKHRFGVITFEHDAYRLGNDNRDRARELLKAHGYVLVVSDLGFHPEHAYEDWYIHPAVVEFPKAMATPQDRVNFVWDYFMEPLTEENSLEI